MSDRRERLSVRSRPKLSRELLAQADFEDLWLKPQFKRFLFTLFRDAGMFASNFHPDGRIHAMSEGRRGLGLELLRTAQRIAGEDALALVIAEEAKAPKETPNDDQPDFIAERDLELGGAEPVEPPAPQFVDYSNAE